MVKWRATLVITTCLACFSLVLLFVETYQYHAQVNRLSRDLMTMQDEMTIKAGNWTNFIELRINRLAQTQDEYQASTTYRIKKLEDRIKELEKKK